MSQKPIRSLADFADLGLLDDVRKPEDVQGMPLTVNGVKFAHGSFGEYALIKCVDKDGVPFTVQTGATIICEALHKALASRAFPCEMTIIEKGRAWSLQ